MRRNHVIFSIIVLAAVSAIFLLGPAAFAKSNPKLPAAKSTTQKRVVTASSNGKTQIITDQKTNTVYILINGKKVVTIDAKGLHVNGSVDYTGTITDRG